MEVAKVLAMFLLLLQQQCPSCGDPINFNQNSLFTAKDGSTHQYCTIRHWMCDIEYRIRNCAPEINIRGWKRWKVSLAEYRRFVDRPDSTGGAKPDLMDLLRPSDTRCVEVGIMYTYDNSLAQMAMKFYCNRTKVIGLDVVDVDGLLCPEVILMAGDGPAEQCTATHGPMEISFGLSSFVVLKSYSTTGVLNSYAVFITNSTKHLVEELKFELDLADDVVNQLVEEDPDDGCQCERFEQYTRDVMKCDMDDNYIDEFPYGSQEEKLDQLRIDFQNKFSVQYEGLDNSSIKAESRIGEPERYLILLTIIIPFMLC